MKILMETLCSECSDKLAEEVRVTLRSFVCENDATDEEREKVKSMFQSYKLVGVKFLLQDPSGTFMLLTHGEDKFKEEADASEEN